VDRVTEAVGQWITHEAVRRYLDGLNALDPGLVVSAYTPTAVIRRAPMGVAEFRAYLEQVKIALADLQIAPREHFETEHGVAAAWTLRATTKAGRTVTCDGIDSWLIGPGGKIESVDVFYDPAPLVEALRD
jgi:ketosteroid isomerase-like protein